MNKYIIIILSSIILFLGSNILSYSKGISTGIDQQKSIQSDITAKLYNENNQSISNFNLKFGTEESKIIYKFKDRVITKEIIKLQYESCVTSNDISNVLNKGIK